MYIYIYIYTDTDTDNRSSQKKKGLAPPGGHGGGSETCVTSALRMWKNRLRNATFAYWLSSTSYRIGTSYGKTY